MNERNPGPVHTNHSSNLHHNSLNNEEIKEQESIEDYDDEIQEE